MAIKRRKTIHDVQVAVSAETGPESPLARYENTVQAITEFYLLMDEHEMLAGTPCRGTMYLIAALEPELYRRVLRCWEYQLVDHEDGLFCCDLECMVHPLIGPDQAAYVAHDLVVGPERTCADQRPCRFAEEK